MDNNFSLSPETISDHIRDQKSCNDTTLHSLPRSIERNEMASISESYWLVYYSMNIVLKIDHFHLETSPCDGT